MVVRCILSYRSNVVLCGPWSAKAPAEKGGTLHSSGCLALNASFEPLTILPIRRALRLVIDQKAEILEVDESRVFRSAKRDMPCPLVIRLVRYIHVPRKFRRQVTNTFLFARDGYSCCTAAGTGRAARP
jgi:hypothetical protein